MLPKQKELIEYIKRVQTLLSPYEDGESRIYPTEKLRELQEQMAEQELIVPIVGGFSAGKSTLINALLEEDYLPVDITPETSLAAELHYVASTDQERLELLSKSNEIQKFAKGQFEEVKKQAENSRLVRVYLNNENLKHIEPLVLVDMPGFESPLDIHNQAIFSYIDKGVYYIVLISIMDGTLTKSMKHQISDIQSADERGNFQRDFSFFLSKIDLRSADDGQEVKQNLEDQLEVQLDLKKSVELIDKNNSRYFREVLTYIDPNTLFLNIYHPTLKATYYDVIENINLLIASLKKDTKSNEENIKALIEGKAQIEKKNEQAISEIESRYSSASIHSIVNYVGSQLSASIDELVATAKQGKDSLAQQINEISRSALIHKTGKVLENIAESVTRDFSTELDSLNDKMRNVLNNEKMTKYTEQLRDKVIDSLKNITARMASKSEQGSSKRRVLYKAVSTILGITTSIVAPSVEVLIIFLPELINFFTKGAQEKKQNEEIKSQLLTTTIPDVKRKISEELQVHFKQQVQGIIEQVSKQFTEQLSQHEDAIRKAQEEQDKNKEQLEQHITGYEKLRKEIEDISRPVLFELRGVKA